MFSCKQENTGFEKEDSFSSGNYTELKDNDTDYEEDKNYNGTYCAEVEYYNPNTGTRSTYELDVEVEDDYLVQINWPNGGWLDETHFSSEDISSGECSFTSDKGYQYTVTLGEKGGDCYNEGHHLQNDVNADVENTTCPRCGDEKYEYEDYCSICQNELEEKDAEVKEIEDAAIDPEGF